MHHFIWSGGLCYKYIPDAKKRKLGDKSEVMILVGHHATDAYKLYDPATQNMSIGRDMVINEGSSWNWQSRSNSSKPHISSLLSDNDNCDESSDEEVEKPNVKVGDRPRRTRNISFRLQNCEPVNEYDVTEEANLVHIALLANDEPINHHEALMNEAWKIVIKE